MKPGPGLGCLSVWQTSSHFRHLAEWSHRLDQPFKAKKIEKTQILAQNKTKRKIAYGKDVKIRKREIIFQNHWINVNYPPAWCSQTLLSPCHGSSSIVQEAWVFAESLYYGDCRPWHSCVNYRDLGSKRLHHGARRSLPASMWLGTTSKSLERSRPRP